MVDNGKGLVKLMDNVREYKAGDKTLLECLTIHQRIVYNDLDSHIEYFSDGWSKDITMNLFKYVLRAVDGDSDAYSRLRVDLGIEDCNLTIQSMN